MTGAGITNHVERAQSLDMLLHVCGADRRTRGPLGSLAPWHPPYAVPRPRGAKSETVMMGALAIPATFRPLARARGKVLRLTSAGAGRGSSSTSCSAASSPTNASRCR